MNITFRVQPGYQSHLVQCVCKFARLGHLVIYCTSRVQSHEKSCHEFQQYEALSLIACAD